MAEHRRRTLFAHITHSVGTLACALLVYYGLPLRTSDRSDVVGLVIFLVGFVGLIFLIARQIVRYVASPPNAGGRLMGVLTVLYAVVVFFSLTYYLIERNSPGQFVDLESRTDALYYTVVTLGTVGYGDVHAAGQAARAVTMLQITFDLVVIGVLFAVASAQVVDRLRAARSEQQARSTTEDGEAGGSGRSARRPR